MQVGGDAKRGGALWQRRCSLLIGLLVMVVLGGCSVKRLMADSVGEALSGDSDVYASEEDPDLVREAIPFGLKMLEGLLAISPGHRGMLLSAAKGFTTYTYLLQDEADRLEAVDVDRSRLLRARSQKLYLRGRGYALRGLNLAHPRFEELLRRDHFSTLAKTTKDDVLFLLGRRVLGRGPFCRSGRSHSRLRLATDRCPGAPRR